MSNDWNIRSFRQECESWLCDRYSCDIRYVSKKNSSPTPNELLIASITFTSQINPRDLGFRTETEHLIAGLVQHRELSHPELRKMLETALEGAIVVGQDKFELPFSVITHNRVMGGPDQWAQQLQMRVSSTQVGYVPNEPKPMVFTPALDDELRRGDVPFDGFDDLITWLSLPDPRFNGSSGTITVTVEPPAQLDLEKCRLENDTFELWVRAHSKFNTSDISLAVRGAPGGGIAARRQLGKGILWERDQQGDWKGSVCTSFEEADQAIAILMIGSACVRRHWFTDPVKARNVRYVAMQTLDHELKQLRRYLFAPERDKDRFEQAVANLLFLRGFNPALPLETDASDILLMTPGGQLVLVECTTSVKDVPTKIGKLVARRDEIRRALTVSGHSPDVVACLACLSPRDQIAASYDDLMKHQVLLWSNEDLRGQFEKLRFPNDVDKEIMEIKRQLATAASFDVTASGGGSPSLF